MERHLISLIFLGDDHRSLDDALFLHYARSGDVEFEFECADEGEKEGFYSG
jgi:hypothetical protein